jgi:xanthosine utilization system XapX-like protein
VRFAVGNLGDAVAIVVALTPTSWSAPAALALIGLVAVYYIAERTPAARDPSDASVP